MVLSGTQEMISFDAFWFTSWSPFTALGAVTEAVFEAFCVAFAEGFFVVDSVLDAAGFLVDDTLEPSGLLEGAGVSLCCCRGSLFVYYLCAEMVIRIDRKSYYFVLLTLCADAGGSSFMGTGGPLNNIHLNPFVIAGICLFQKGIEGNITGASCCNLCNLFGKGFVREPAFKDISVQSSGI